MILSFFIMYKKKYILILSLHRAPTIYTLHQQSAMWRHHPTCQSGCSCCQSQEAILLTGYNDKLCWHWLPPILGVPKAPQDDSHICVQSHHNDQPSCQRLALVGKKCSRDVMLHAQLMSERAEDLQHKPTATADLHPHCHTRANTQHDTQCNNQCCYAIECIYMPMPIDVHNDRDCHNNCDVSTHTQFTAPLQLNRLQQSTISW